MVRTLISLPDQDLKKLNLLAQKSKKSRTQLVREAVELYLKKNQHKQESWHDLIRRTAGLWKHKNIDGLEYERKLREEWDDR